MGPRPRALALAVVILGSATCWFLYVPIHELLHVLGCEASGGRVQELELSPLYGGKILEHVFPFVVSGGEYAGRLSRFDTGSSDVVYLITDYAPFLLTLFGGAPLLRLARNQKNPWLLAPGAVLVTAPFVSLFGDFYEMGSILLVAGLAHLPGGPAETMLRGLRHDDLFALIKDFPDRFPESRMLWGTAVALSFALGAALAGLTLAASRGLAALLPSKRSAT